MNPTIIITGVNNGIGLAMTNSLLAGRDRVDALDQTIGHIDQTNEYFLCHDVPREAY